MVTILLLAGLVLNSVLPGRFTGRGSLGLVAVLALAGYTGGPVILAGAMVLAAAAWKMARV